MVRRILHFTLRKLWLALAFLLVLAAVVLSVVRYSLPYLDNYRENIETLVAERFNQEVRIGALSADWSAFGPSLVLENVVLKAEPGYPISLAVERTHLVLNLWQSMWQREWILEDFVLDGVHLGYELDWQRASSTDLALVDAIEQLLLFQLESFQVVDSLISVNDENGTERELFIEQLSWVNRGVERQGTGLFRVSDVTTNNFNFILNARGARFLDMQGELYLEAEDVDLSSWFEAVIDGVEITEAQLNVNAWLDFEQGAVSLAQVHFGENSLRWQRDGRQHTLVTSPFTWGFWPQPGGFLMSSESLTIEVDQVQWPVESIRWGYADGHHNWHLRNLSFSETAPLWSLFGSPGAQIRDWFAGIQPEGLVNDVQVALSPDYEWFFYAHAESLNWQSHQGVPGLSGLSFEFWSSEQEGAFALRGNEVSIVSPMTYSDAQQLSQIDWLGYWHRLDDGFRVALPRGKVSLANVEFDQQFSLTREGGRSPVVEWWLQGDGANLPVTDALELLPLQLGPNLNEYLRTALIDGEVNRLNMLWRGDLELFPYHQHDGTFMASIIAESLNFKFQPDWPAIYDTELQLEYRDHSLNFSARGGDLLGAQLLSVDAHIPEIIFPEPWLLLEAEARGDLKQARSIFEQSPFADTVGATLAQLSSEDEFVGRFNLDIPLFTAEKGGHDDEQADVNVRGEIKFEGQSLHLDAVELELQDLAGGLRFEGATLNAQSMRATVLGLPVHVYLQGAPAEASDRLRARDADIDEAYQLDIQFDGNWPAQTMADSAILSWLAPYADGNLLSDSSLSLHIADGMLDYQWRMRNSLEHLAIELPRPFNREAGSNEYVDVLAQGDETGLNAQIIWPHTVRFETELMFGAEEFARALLELGPTTAHGPALPESGMDVLVNLEQLALSSWLGMASVLTDGGGTGLPWALPALKGMQAQVTELDLLDQRFDDVVINGEVSTEGWVLNANAAQGRAQVKVPLGSQASDAGERDSFIRVHIDYLNLAKPSSRSPKEQEQASSGLRPSGKFFDGLPPLHVVCELCRYDDKELGRVEFELDPRKSHQQLTSLSIRRSGAEVSLTGGWQQFGEQYHSHLDGWIAIRDVGNLFADFGSSSVVRDSSAQVEVNLDWSGSPAEFDLANLNGEVDWLLGSGYLRDVSDGGARLFSLFSLESLVRKLTLDFRDIFARGMFYSSFRGTLSIEDGVVYTDNTRMNGSAGDMEVTGSTNLVTEALDYQLVYVPKVTSSLPVLVAWMVNPPTGLAALLIDRVLHDAQVISRLEYSITGTVSDPVVNEEARAQREVELPEVELEQLMEDNDDAN